MHNPIAYYTLLSLWLEKPTANTSPDGQILTPSWLRKISVSGVIDAIPRSLILYEELQADNGKQIATIFALRKNQQLFLIYMQLLPAEFGLFTPLDDKRSLQFYTELLQVTVKNCCRYARHLQCKTIVTDIYNPNLLPLFTLLNFQPVEPQQQKSTPVVESVRLQLAM